MKLWVKFEGASDTTALKVALSDEGVNSGDIDVADLLKDYIPGVLDVGGRQPSSLRLIKYTPPSSALDAAGSGEENAHSNFTTIKEVLEAANKAVADATAAAPEVVEEPVTADTACEGDDGDEAASSPPPPATPTPAAPPQIIVFSVRLLDHTPEVAVVSTPSASPAPPARTSRVSASAPKAATTTRVAASAASSRGSGGWNGSSRAVSTASSTAAPAPKSYVRQQSTNAAAASSSGRVSLMDRSKQYAKTAADSKAVSATPATTTTGGARTGSAVRGGRISTTVSSSRGASPVVRAPAARVAAPAPKPKPASRVATPTRRLSEARPGEVPPLSAPSPRRNSGAVDPDDLPPPSHDPSDNEAPEQQEGEEAAAATETATVVPTSAKRVEHPSPTPDRPVRTALPRTSTSPSRRGPHATKSPQPFDRQLSRSALAATPRSRSNQTPDHNASMNSSHATTTTSDAGPAPEYVSRLYPDPEDVKKREKEVQRRAALSKPQVSPAEKKQKAVYQREASNRMYNAAANKGAPTAEVCVDFKPLWGQSTCAKCQHGKTAHILKKREMDREAKMRTPTLPVASDDGSAPAKGTPIPSSTRTAPRAAVAKASTPLRRPVSTARAPSATTTPASARTPATRSTPTRQPVARDSPKPVRTASGARTPLSSSTARLATPTIRTAAPAAGTAVKAAAGRGTPTRPPMSPMRRLGSTAGTPASAARKAPVSTSSKKAAPSPSSSAKKQPPQSPLKKSDVSSTNPIIEEGTGDATPARPAALDDPASVTPPNNESFFLSKEGSPVNLVSSPVTTSVTAPGGSEEERRQREADELESVRRAAELEKRECTPENTSTTAGRPELEMTPGTAMMMMCSDSSPDRSAISNTPVAAVATPEATAATPNGDDEKKKKDDDDKLVFDDDEASPSSPDFRKPSTATADEGAPHNDDRNVSAATNTPATTSEEPPRTTAPPSASPPFDPFGDIDEDLHHQEEQQVLAAAAASRDVSISNNDGVAVEKDEDASALPNQSNDVEEITTTTPTSTPATLEAKTVDDVVVPVVADVAVEERQKEEETPKVEEAEQVEAARPPSASVDPNAATVSMSEEDEFAFLNDVPESVEPSPQPSRVEEEESQPEQAAAPASPITVVTSDTEGTKTQRPPSRTRGPRSGSTPRCSSASGRASGRSSVNNSPSRSVIAGGGSFKRQNSWRQASCHHQQLEEAGLSNGSGRSPQASAEASGTGVPPLSPSLTPRDPSTSHFDPDAAPPTTSEPADDNNGEEPEVNGRPTLPPPSDDDEKEMEKNSNDDSAPEESNNNPPAAAPSSSPPTSPQFGLLSGVAAFLAETEAEGVEHVDMSALPPRSPARTTPATSGPPSQEVSRTSSMNKISRTVFEEY